MQWYPTYNAMMLCAIISGHVSHGIILLTTRVSRMADYPVYQSMTDTSASDKIADSLDILACSYIRTFPPKSFFCKIVNFRICNFM